MSSVNAASWKIMALGLLGALVCTVVFFWGVPFPPDNQALSQTPEFTIWFAVNAVLFALYPIIGVLIVKSLSQHRMQFAAHWLEIAGSSVLFFCLFMLLAVAGGGVIDMQSLPIPYAAEKLLIVEIAGFFAAALPLAINIWLIQAAIADGAWDIPAVGEIQTYIGVREQLQTRLTLFGVLLSLLILAAAAMRSLAIATQATSAEQYPTIFLLAMGAYYTLLVALIYYPAHYTLTAAGNRLLDACFPLPAPGSDGWSSTVSKRKTLEDMLELKVSPEQRFVTSVTLLAPFLSSIFTLLIQS